MTRTVLTPSQVDFSAVGKRLGMIPRSTYRMYHQLKDAMDLNEVKKQKLAEISEWKMHRASNAQPKHLQRETLLARRTSSDTGADANSLLCRLGAYVDCDTSTSERNEHLGRRGRAGYTNSDCGNDHSTVERVKREDDGRVVVRAEVTEPEALAVSTYSLRSLFPLTSLRSLHNIRAW